ncbi:unnamed protein product, partial [Brenthis ino]
MLALCKGKSNIKASEEVADDRTRWRKLYGDGVKLHNRAWLNELARKRAYRHQRDTKQLHQPSSSQQNLRLQQL